MSTSEPEAWSFSEDKFKKYESENSSSEDSSDDEQLFSKTKTIKTKSLKNGQKGETLIRIIFSG